MSGTATISYSLALRSNGSALLLIRYARNRTSSPGCTRNTSKGPIGLNAGVALLSNATSWPTANFCPLIFGASSKRARINPDPSDHPTIVSGDPPSAPVHSRSPSASFATARSGGLKFVGGHFARPRILDELVADLLTLLQVAQSGAFNCTDMNESVAAPVVRLNEAEALRCVVPLHCASRHDDPFQMST